MLESVTDLNQISNSVFTSTKINDLEHDRAWSGESWLLLALS